jgi:hypothetical protein
MSLRYTAVGTFERRAGGKGPFQNGTQIKTPIVGVLVFPAPLTAALNDRQNSGDNRCRILEGRVPMTSLGPGSISLRFETMSKRRIRTVVIN